MINDTHIFDILSSLTCSHQNLLIFTYCTKYTSLGMLVDRIKHRNIPLIKK